MIQNNNAFRLLSVWGKSYSNNKLEIKFDEYAPIGSGEIYEDSKELTVGIRPIKRGIISRYQQIDDYLIRHMTGLYQKDLKKMFVIENYLQDSFAVMMK